jgi:hypothetical protein
MDRSAYIAYCTVRATGQFEEYYLLEKKKQARLATVIIAEIELGYVPVRFLCAFELARQSPLPHSPLFFLCCKFRAPVNGDLTISSYE